MGSHSILEALWDKVGLVGQGKGIRKVASTSGTLPHHHGRVSVSVLAKIQLTAYYKLGSIVLDHHARYTEADVIPCTGEEPGEAKEREALRGAVLKQVWAQTLGGAIEEWEALRQGSTQYLLSGLSYLPSGLTLFFLLPFL